jgi:hypothetical protein
LSRCLVHNPRRHVTPSHSSVSTPTALSTVDSEIEFGTTEIFHIGRRNPDYVEVGFIGSDKLVSGDPDKGNWDRFHLPPSFSISTLTHYYREWHRQHFPISGRPHPLSTAAYQPRRLSGCSVRAFFPKEDTHGLGLSITDFQRYQFPEGCHNNLLSRSACSVHTFCPFLHRYLETIGRWQVSRSQRHPGYHTKMPPTMRPHAMTLFHPAREVSPCVGACNPHSLRSEYSRNSFKRLSGIRRGGRLFSHPSKGCCCTELTRT